MCNAFVDDISRPFGHPRYAPDLLARQAGINKDMRWQDLQLWEGLG